MDKTRVIFNQSDPDIIIAADRKVEQVRHWLDIKGLDGVIISRRDNFAWITCGGDNRVVNPTEMGVGHIVITKKKKYLVAYYMDAERLYNEQAPGQDYELVTLFWHQGDERNHARELAGKKVGADTFVPDTAFVHEEIMDLQWPLNEIEVARTRWLGMEVSQVLEKLFGEVEPGMTEKEISNQMRSEIIRRGMDLDVTIVGSDERIFKYRHILPTEKKLEKYLVLGPVVRRWGLHALVSRSVHFGEPPDVVKKAFLAAATIEGRVIAGLKEGLKYSEIFTNQKQWYKELGVEDGWNYHFPGGPTGYTLVDAARALTEKVVQSPQPYSWFTTVRGAKVEELSLLTSAGPEIVSLSQNWPTISVSTKQGPYTVPGMLIR